MSLKTAAEWASAFVQSTDLDFKFNPPEVPPSFVHDGGPIDIRPGRPEAFEVVAKAPGLRGAHRSVRARAKAAHTFMHHELQAAELMCWCLLRFPDTPLAFQQGLIRIALDEIRHMNMYREYIETAGFEVGAFPVRDWFWERVPQCDTPTMYVATMGIGFEGANLDHAERFANIFEDAGDSPGAAMQRHVGREEIGHVRFATHWFAEWNESLSFDAWSASLPKPLSPMVMRGDPLNRDARSRAGLPEDFFDRLTAWTGR